MKKVLIIEDEKDVRTTIVDLLENVGYTTISAKDGLEAIKFLEHDVPDLVISDIMMPNADGYQVLEYFQKLPGASTVPFIFLSAKVEYSDLRMGMNYGADDYLTKPFRAKELLQCVDVQLKKKEKLDKKFENVFTDISAYVPHELRTPLIPIIGYSELITEGIAELTKEEIFDMVQKIKISSRRLHKTVEKFIRYAGTRLKLALKDTNRELDNVFIQSPCLIIEYISRKMFVEANRGDDLVLELEDSPVRISSNDFEFLVEEILENALKFSNPGTKINIKCYAGGDKYTLEITDHGRGISKEQIADINPFDQHERNKYNQAGIGLGLVSIKNITSLYNGTMKLTSALNEFTTCAVSLPTFICN